MAHSPGLDLARPTNGHRDAQAAFVKIALAPAKLHAGPGVLVGTMDAARMIRRAKVIIATIVSAEKHNGILVELQLLQKIQYLPHLPIHHAHHRGITPGLLRPFFLVLIDRPSRVAIWNIKYAVWRRNGKITEERPILVVFNELDGFIEDFVVGIICACAAALIPRQRHLLTIANNVGRIITVRMDLVVVSQKHIEPMFLRHAR